MKKIKNCKYCYESFESRRSNHVYCTLSCKTKASYKRNGYKYVTGHYKKEEIALDIPENELPVSNEFFDGIKALETKIDSIIAKPEINGGSISNVAIGSAAADATIYAGKKLFAPQTLPATKGDVDALKQEIQNLKFLFKMKSM
ncbi:hypothetical protein [Bizionia myxarmorum]|uniref:Uncharacterized protein n=1 Tax=Bizionia myxarmorum TaxID=291186 RepID=A0A5D0RC92_9FLAO|nr:hypothetical protein [Bizionia myxarmorum]TYB79167.1 hypothetical protein ES674_05170 [Bizionia myxarmorum]